MRLQEAKYTVAAYFSNMEEYRPTHCDVRCMINDLYPNEYNQDNAHKHVLKLLKIAQKLKEASC